MQRSSWEFQLMNSVFICLANVAKFIKTTEHTHERDLILQTISRIEELDGDALCIMMKLRTEKIAKSRIHKEIFFFVNKPKNKTKNFATKKELKWNSYYDSNSAVFISFTVELHVLH